MSVAGRRPWTGKERVLVRDNYRSKGAIWCAQQLNRTQASVQIFAARHGFNRPASDLIQPSEFLDARIRSAYAEGRGAALRLARSAGISLGWITRRAGELGLSMRPGHSTPYSREEAEFVEAHTHLSRHRISTMMRERGWKRTAASIECFIKYHGVADNGDFLSPNGLAMCLGVQRKTIWRWTEAGELPAHLRDGKDESGAWRTYALTDVARFIVQHPHRIDLRKVDGPWLIDLLARYGSLGLVDEQGQWRRILALHKLGKSNQEIATILDTKPNIVASTLSQRRDRASQQEAA